MGGPNSEIKDTTTQLLFESAKFARDNIRKTARGLGQNTDASSHYEKGISEYTTELGMARALHPIQSWAAARSPPPILTVPPVPRVRASVSRPRSAASMPSSASLCPPM